MLFLLIGESPSGKAPRPGGAFGGSNLKKKL